MLCFHSACLSITLCLTRACLRTRVFAACRKEVRGQRLRSARSRRDEEDAHEDWLSEQDRLRALAEAEACRRMAEERQKAEQEARQLAEAADKAAKKAAKEAAGAAKK